MGICSGFLLFVWAVELGVANVLVFVARKRWERVLGPGIVGCGEWPECWLDAVGAAKLNKEVAGEYFCEPVGVDADSYL